MTTERVAIEVQMIMKDAATNTFNNIRNNVEKLKDSIKKTNFQIEKMSIKKSNVKSDGWKVRYGDMITGLKLQRLEMKKNLDSSMLDLSLNKERIRKMNVENMWYTKQIAFSKKMFSGKAQGLINEVSMTQRLADKYDSFSGVLGMTQEQYKRVNLGGATFNTTGGKMGNRLRMVTAGLRGFRMEMLGVMFGAGMLGHAMLGLFQPATEAFGIFDLFGTTLQVVFLPVMELLFPILLGIMDFFMNLSPSIQLAIGIFTGLVAVIMIVAGVIASIALFVGSAIGAVMFLPIVIGIAIAAVVVILTWCIAWIITNFDKIWKFIVGIWDNIVKGIKIAIDSLMTKVFTPLISFLKNVWDLIVLSVKLAWELIKNLISSPIDTIKKVWKDLGTFFSNLWSGIWGTIKGFVNLILGGVNAIIAGLNKIKFSLPSWIPGVGGKSFGINIPTVPLLAEGGIVNKPTLAMIGEKGPEAVVPLGKGNSAGGITINQYITVTGSLKEEIASQIKDNNAWLVDKIKSLTGIRG